MFSGKDVSRNGKRRLGFLASAALVLGLPWPWSGRLAHAEEVNWWEAPVVTEAPAPSDALDQTADPGEDAAPQAAAAKAHTAAPAQAAAPASCCAARTPAPCACGAAAANAAASHKGLFYNNDFAYLLKPGARSYLGDAFKRRRFGDCITYDIGGQLRIRQHSERNHRLLGLTGLDDDFLLYRTRLYANVELGGALRAYAEMIDAVSHYENLGPRPIEENRADLLNLFGDVRLWDAGGGQLWARLGRQELLYGNQRTVSSLDWANTRRTFEGYKTFWKGPLWNIDAFWVRPMRVAADRFDSPNYDQQFLGLYATRTYGPGKLVDLYYLRLDDDASDFEFDTLGGRLTGAHGPWAWEVEGAAQLGDYQGLNHTAGFWTVGLSRKLASLPGSPMLWVWYDWASGSDELNNGYHHLFPLSHKYMGFMDLFGRRNIETPNVQLILSPCDKLKLMLWYYVFFLENKNDVPYSVAMTPFNPGNAPADPYLGQELDLTADWTISPRLSLLCGYSHFFTGDYYKQTPGVPHRGDADFFYTQMTLNY